MSEAHPHPLAPLVRRWALVTVTTVGYGDAVPQTSAGRLVAAVAMVTGVVGISTIISIMTQVTDLPCPPYPSLPLPGKSPSRSWKPGDAGSNRTRPHAGDGHGARESTCLQWRRVYRRGCCGCHRPRARGRDVRQHITLDGAGWLSGYWGGVAPWIAASS